MSIIFAVSHYFTPHRRRRRCLGSDRVVKRVQGEEFFVNIGNVDTFGCLIFFFLIYDLLHDPVVLP